MLPVSALVEQQEQRLQLELKGALLRALYWSMWSLSCCLPTLCVTPCMLAGHICLHHIEPCMCWRVHVLLLVSLLPRCCWPCCPAGSNNAQGSLTVSAQFLPFSEALLTAAVADNTQVRLAWSSALFDGCG